VAVVEPHKAEPKRAKTKLDPIIDIGMGWSNLNSPNHNPVKAKMN